jgi:hypothetical protein
MPFLEVEVSVTKAGGGNAHQHFLRLRFVNRNSFDLKRAGYCMKNSGAHLRPHCSA